MLKTDVSIGRTFVVNGKAERVEKFSVRNGLCYVNSKSLDLIEPLVLTDEVFEELNFRYYNGWYCPFDEDPDKDILTFVKDDDCYICYIGAHEVRDVRITSLHELQDIIYYFKGELV